MEAPEAQLAAPVEQKDAMDVDNPAAEKGEDGAGAASPAGKPHKTPAAGAKPKAPSEAGTGTGGRVQRERKQVDFFTVAAPKKEEEQAVTAVGEGSGTKLRDIPNVAFKMQKLTGQHELMEGLHNVLYRRKGVANQRKKAILDFSGFAFSDDTKVKEVEARRASLSKWKLELLHKLMDTLDLQRGSGDKAAKVERVLEFLQEPKATSDVDLAEKVKSKKEQEKAKRERAAAKKEKAAAKKDKDKAKKEKEAAAKRKSAGGSAAPPAKKAKKEAQESEAEEESEPEAEEEAEEEAGSEEEVMPSSKRRGGGGARQRKAAVVEEEEEEEDEEAPAAIQEDAAPAAEQAPEGKADNPASKVGDAELAAEVEAILRATPGADLATITCKSILKQLEAKNGFSLKPRKQEVASIAQAFVLKYIEEHPEGAAEASDAAAPPAAAATTATDDAPVAAEAEAGGGDGGEAEGAAAAAGAKGEEPVAGEEVEASKAEGEAPAVPEAAAAAAQE